MDEKEKKVLITYKNETLQFPSESDGTLLLSTFKGTFSEAIGLSFINTDGITEILKQEKDRIFIKYSVDRYDARSTQSKKRIFFKYEKITLQQINWIITFYITSFTFTASSASVLSPCQAIENNAEFRRIKVNQYKDAIMRNVPIGYFKIPDWQSSKNNSKKN